MHTEQSFFKNYCHVHIDNGKSVLHGVVSWSVGCDITDRYGAVFASVFSMIGFINDVLVRICDSCFSILFINFLLSKN